MPANLTPDYLEAEREYKQAATPREKIAALERMFATLPKHKGTEKLQADIRKRLSQARKESQKKGAVHSTPFYLVEKEGAGQVALVGPPNSGKSSLVAALTHARPEVADYPFTTRAPMPGMLQFEDVQIQLVDLPPLSPEFTEPWLPQAIRPADFTALVADPNDAAVLEGVDYALRLLIESRLPAPRLMIGTHGDCGGAGANFAALSEMYPSMRSLLASTVDGRGLDELGRALFDELQIVRVYTKVPGKKADLTAPYILRRGSTVQDAARHVHKDFAEQLKYARLFHPDGRHDGMMVERTHLVEDRDILEFHV